MMNTSNWTFLLYPLLALLRLSSSIFIATWYSSQALIAPTRVPSYWWVRRTSPPKSGTHHCIWITRSTPFHSHCGLSSYCFLIPYFTDPGRLLGVCYSRNTWIKTLFLFFHSTLRWPCIYYLRLAFVRKDHPCSILRWPCIYLAPLIIDYRAHPVLVMFNFKLASHFLVYSCLLSWLFPYVLVAR